MRRQKHLQVSVERLINRSSERLIGAIIQELNAISNAISFAKFYSRSHDAVIRVYVESGAVTETHEHKGDFQSMVGRLLLAACSLNLVAA